MRSLQLVLCSVLCVGLCQRVCEGGVVSVNPGRPSLVVKHLQPSACCFPRGGSPRPSLLVKRVRPGVGSASTGPFCFGTLVSSGTLPFDQPSGATCGPLGPIPVSSPGTGSGCGIVCGQHHCSFVCQEASGDILPSAQSGGLASLLGRGVGDHSGSPIHYGGPECDCRLPESSTSGPGV